MVFGRRTFDLGISSGGSWSILKKNSVWLVGGLQGDNPVPGRACRGVAFLPVCYQRWRTSDDQNVKHDRFWWTKLYTVRYPDIEDAFPTMVVFHIHNQGFIQRSKPPRFFLNFSIWLKSSPSWITNTKMVSFEPLPSRIAMRISCQRSGLFLMKSLCLIHKGNLVCQPKMILLHWTTN